MSDLFPRTEVPQVNLPPSARTAAEALAAAGITAEDAEKLKRLCDLFLLGAEDTTAVLTAEEKASALAQFDAQLVSSPNQEAPPASKVTGFIWKDRQGVPHLICMSGAESGQTNFVRTPNHNGVRNAWIRTSREGDHGPYGPEQMASNRQVFFDAVLLPGSDLVPQFTDGRPGQLPYSKMTVFSDGTPDESAAPGGYCPTIGIVGRGNRHLGVSEVGSETAPTAEIRPDGSYRKLSGLNGIGFVTRWTVSGDAIARTITLPLVTTGGAGFECLVDWGDGTPRSIVTTYDSASRAHTYAADGTYDVEIRGKCEGWSFNNAGDRTKFVGVVCWGGADAFLGFKYLNTGFYGCSNFTISGLGKLLPQNSAILELTQTFRGCPFTSLPVGFLDDFPNITSLSGTFWASGLTSVHAELLDKLTRLTNISYAFVQCNLTSVPAGFLDSNPDIVGLAYTFAENPDLTALPSRLLAKQAEISGAYCFSSLPKLQLNADLFYSEGEQATHFATGTVQDFTGMFYRDTFTGVQGTAPDLWNCDFGETITLDVAPATDWAPGDTITGQSSGATAVVVSKTSALVYRIKKHFGTFTLGEVVGVTGNAAKLADQGAANPTFAGKPISASCFGGAGNSLASLSNYASIPASWR